MEPNMGQEDSGKIGKFQISLKRRVLLEINEIQQNQNVMLFAGSRRRHRSTLGAQMRLGSDRT